jgi:hypothetical protein
LRELLPLLAPSQEPEQPQPSPVGSHWPALSPEPWLVELAQETALAPWLAEPAQELSLAPWLVELAQELAPAPWLAEPAQELSLAPWLAELAQELSLAPWLAELAQELSLAPWLAEPARQLSLAPWAAESARQLSPHSQQERAAMPQEACSIGRGRSMAARSGDPALPRTSPRPLAAPAARVFAIRLRVA